MTKDVNRVPPKAERESEPTTTDAVSPPSRGPLWTRKRLAIALCVSLAVHAVGLTYACVRLRGGQTPPAAEVSLGVFRYLGDRVEGSRLAYAEFAVHAAPVDQPNPAARATLAAYKYRIQQTIEELLRRAHAGDFEDPVLKTLKRKIQDRIEETLGARIIEDVILTDLKVQWNTPETKPTSETAELVPWLEKRSG